MLGYMLSLSEVLTVTASLTVTLSTSYTTSLTVTLSTYILTASLTVILSTSFTASLTVLQADGTTWWHNVGFEDGSSYQVTWCAVPTRVITVDPLF